MQELQILNGKQAKEIHEELKEHYGFAGKIEAVFLLSEKKQKIYLFTRDVAEIDLTKFRIDSMGMYFGALYDGKFRFSIEGSQMIGAQCTKNVFELTREEMQQWLKGEKITLNEEQKENMEGFVLVKYKNDFLGAGKVAGDMILNYVPKTRYIHADYN